MGLIEIITERTENHFPIGIQLAKNYGIPYVNEGSYLRGRSVLFGGALCSSAESITFFALNILSSLVVGLTSGQFVSLNRASLAFRNKGLESAAAAFSLLGGSILHPNIAVHFNKDTLSSLEIIDEDQESEELSLTDEEILFGHLRRCSILNEGTSKVF